MTIQRDILGRIKPFLKRKEYIAITGARQCGKTTFLEILREHLIKNEAIPENRIHYISFEDRKMLSEFVSDPVAFVHSFIPQGNTKKIFLLFDEFQYVPDGGQKLKLVYDTVKNLKVIITGSSSLEIKAQIGRFMVGRILTFNMFPLDFGEFLSAKDRRLAGIHEETNKHLTGWVLAGRRPKFKSGADAFAGEFLALFDEYCVWGGYPAVVLSGTLNERKKVLGDILNNYLLKDIKGLLNLATDDNLMLLAQYLAVQAGNITVYDSLSRTAGLDFRRMKQHLNILKETFICTELKPFSANRQKELIKSPKIYFIDIGFRNNLVESMAKLDKRSDAGAIVENAVFNKLFQLTSGAGRLNYWRTKAGAEVDFIFHSDSGIVPVEVKFSEFDGPKISKSFASFTDAYHPKRGLILTKNYWGMATKNGTRILFAPVYCL